MESTHSRPPQPMSPATYPPNINPIPASAAVSITLDTSDTTAPDAPVIIQPTTPTNANPITISGTAEADATVTLTQNGNALTTTADASGVWSIEVTLSADNNGANTFTASAPVTATDAVNNVSDSSTAVTVTLDQTRPTIEIQRPEPLYTNVNPTPIKLTFSEPLMVADADGFEESDITVEGGTITAGSYQVVSGGDVDVTFTITPSGDGLFQVIQLSIDTTNPLTTEDVATDVAGNGNESIRSNFVYDGTTPDAPVITQPTTPTNANPITISGSAEADATVTLSQNGNVLTSSTATHAGSNGDWSIEVTLSADNNGANSFTATASDAAGNVSVASDAVSITLDTTAPAAPVITAPAADTTVNTAAFTLEGTTEAGATVDVLKDGMSIGAAIVTDTDWTFATTLTEGANLFTATATDAAGNTSEASAAATITLDATAPAKPIITPPTDDLVNDASFTLNGTTEAAASIQLLRAGNVITGATTDADTNGDWSITFDLTTGDNVITATASDAAGNPSTPSDAVTITLDMEAPVISLLGSATLSIAKGNTYTDAGATASDTTDGDITNSITSTITFSGNAANAVDTNAVGVYTITYKVSDAAGNAATAVSRVVTVVEAINIATSSQDPTVITAGNKIRVVFFEPLTITAVAGDFTVSGAPSGTTVTALAVGSNNGHLILTLSGTIAKNAVVNLAYTQTAGSISTASGILADFSGVRVLTNNIQAVAPEVETARVSEDGRAIILTFDKDITLNSVSNSRFAVRVGGASFQGGGGVTGLSATGKELTVSLATAIARGMAVTLAYIAPTAAQSGTITGADGSVVAAFNPLAVTNTGQAVDQPTITPPAMTLVNTESLTLSGTGRAGSNVQLCRDLLVSVGSATVDADGDWTTEVMLVGDENSITVQPEGECLLVAQGRSAAIVIVQDTFPPSGPVIQTSAQTFSVAPTSINIGGSADAGSTVALFRGAESVGTATVTDGSWTIVVTALIEGANLFTATATDTAGNVSAVSNAVTLTLDTTAPAVSITSASGESGSTVSSATLRYTATFSEVVTGFELSDITLAGTANGGNPAASNLQGTGAVYTFDVQKGSSDGSVTVSIAADVAMDSAGHSNTASNDYSLTINTASPAVSITSASGVSGGIVSSATLRYTATFSVAVSDFVVGDITVAGTAGVTSASNFAANADSTIFTFDVLRGNSDGSVIVSIAAGVTQGNGQDNIASNQHTLTIDTSVPAKPVITTEAQSVNPARFTLRGTADMDVTSVELFRGIASQGAIPVTAGVWEKTITLNFAFNGANVFTVIASDAAGNVSAVSDAVTITRDATAPLIVSMTSTAQSPTSLNPIPITVSFSEPVTGLDASDITVTNGAVTNGSIQSAGASYAFGITPTADGTITVNIPAAAVVDAAGNSNTAAAPQFTITSDRTPPTVVISTQAQTVSTAAFTLAGTTEAGATVEVFKGGTSIGAASVTGINWTFDVTLTEGANAFTATATDTAGNTADATVSITLDTPPVISLLGSAALSIAKGNTYTDAGATASDTTDGDITNSITSTITFNGNAANAVDTNAVGVYTITYNVSDAAGNAATAVSRVVTVVEAINIATSSQDPTVITAGNKIRVVFFEPLTITAVAGDFTVSGAPSGTTVTALAVGSNNGHLILTLSGTIAKNAVVNLAYTQTAGSISTASGILADFSGVRVLTNNIQAVAPEVETARVSEDGRAIILTFDKDITLNSVSNSRFAVRVGGASFQGGGGVTGLSATGKELTVSLATAIARGMAVTLAYIAPTAAQSGTITGADGSVVAAFNPLAVTNTGQAVDQPTITPPAMTLVNTESLTLSGTGRAGSNVQLCRDLLVSVGSATVDADGDWTTEVMLVGDENSITVQPEGECLLVAQGRSAAIVIVQDTFPPSGPVIQTSAQTFSVAPTSINIGGSADAGSTVALFRGAESVGTATVTDGSWTIVVTALIEGANLFTATATDTAGNVSAVSNAVTLTLDTTAPAVSITSASGESGSTVSSATLRYTATFSEVVTGFELSDITLAGTANGGNPAASNLQGTGAVYTFDVQKGSSDGSVTVSIAADVAMDSAGHSNTASNDYSLTINTASPAVSITSASGVSGGIVSSATLRYTATFSVAVSDFVVGDITVAGTAGVTSASNFAANADSTIFTFDVLRGNSDGSVIVSIAADVAQGNGQDNIASNQHTLTIDTSVPAKPVITTEAQSVNPARFTLRGTADMDVTSVELFRGIASQGAIPVTAGVWEKTITLNFAFNGANVFTVIASDAAGNVSAVSDAVTITRDATAPLIVSMTSTAQSPTSLNPIPITVSFSEPVTGLDASDITVTNGAVTNGSIQSAGASYAFGITPTADGTITVNIPAAAVVDAAGNSNTAAAPQFTITSDRTPPTVVISTQAQTVSTAAFTLAGTTEAGATVEVFKGGTSIGAASVTGINWTFDVTLTEGANAFTATATDTAGNTADATVSITLDTTTAPSISISPNTVTATAGTAIADITITSTGDAVTSYSINPDIANGLSFDASTGTISGTPDAAAPEIIYTITATNTAGTATATVAITVEAAADTTAPVAPLITLPTDDLVTEASLTLSGSAEVGASIQLLRSGTAITSATTDADTNGDWSITFDLTEGENLITATASDTAGNVSAASAAVTITLDTTAPAAPVITTAVVTPPSLIVTTTTPFTVAGTAEAGAEVAIFRLRQIRRGPVSTIQRVPNGTVTADNNGDWTAPISLTEGVSRFVAVATDAAGNVSADSIQFDIKLDTTAPTVNSLTSTAGADGATVETRTLHYEVAFGEFVSGFTANSITVGGSAGGSVTSVSGDPAVRADFYEFDVEATNDGSVIVSIAAGAVQDIAGTGNIASSAHTLTIDAIDAPSISISPATVTVMAGTAIADITITSTGDDVVSYGIAPDIENGLSFDTSTGTISGTPTAVAEAITYTITATNTAGTATATVAITVEAAADTTPPAAPLITSPTDNLVTEASLTLSGTAEVGASIQLLRSGTAITSATIDADTNGDWSITFDLTEGDNVITATASDTAGNVSVASAAVSITLDTTAPAQPVITTAVVTPPSLIVTTTTPFTVTGTAEAGAEVAIFRLRQIRRGPVSTIQRVPNGTVTADNNGGWTAPISLTEGVSNFVAVATDAAGNVSADSIQFDIKLDTTAPTVNSLTSTAGADGATVETRTLHYEVAFGEFVSGFTTNSITVGGSAGGSVTSVSGDPAVRADFYEFDVEATSDGSVIVSIAAGAVQDIAGTGNIASSAHTLTIDAIDAPSISISPATVTVMAGTAIADITITSTGDDVVSYGINPAIGNGLSFDASTGTISGTPDAAAPEIIYTITATNTAGTATATVAITVEADTTPPAAPVITTAVVTPPSLIVTTTTPFTVTGTAEAGAEVAIFRLRQIRRGPISTIQRVPNGTVTADNNGDWTAPISLTEGVSPFVAVATDAAGNVSADSIQFDIKLDTTAPTVNSLTSTAGADGATVETRTLHYEVAFGEFVSGFTANSITVGGSAGGSVTSVSGDPAVRADFYEFDVEVTNDGSVIVSIAAGAVQDIAGIGNIASSAHTLTIDAIDAPSISISPATVTVMAGTAIADITITSTGDDVVSYGIAPDIENGLSFDTSTGTISGTPTAVAEAITYTITATNTAGTATATVAITVEAAADTTPPAAPLITSPTDNLVTEASLTLSGTAEVGASIQLLRSGTAITSATIDADTNGDWSITFDLTEGDNVITATASDTAGNVSVASAAVSITLDTTAPAQPVITTAVVTPPSLIVTTTTPFTVTGTAEAGAEVAIFRLRQIRRGPVSTIQRVPNGTVTADNNGGWTAPISLTEGVSNFVAVATDAAGNVSADSIQFDIKLDTTAPTVNSLTSTAGADGATVETRTLHYEVAFGEFVSGFTTNSITVGGSAGGSVTSVSGDPAVRADFYEFDVEATSDGSVIVSIAAGAVQDIAGTGNIASSAHTLTIDAIHAPSISISPATVTVMAGTAIADITITSTGDAVTSYSIDPAIGNGLMFDTTTGTISGTPDAAAPEIIYTITATNTAGTATATVAITVEADTTPPAVAITTPAQTVNADSLEFHAGGLSVFTLMGTAEVGSTVEIFRENVSHGSAPVTDSGIWTKTVTVFLEGTNEFKATATDTAGNTADATVTITRDTAAPTVAITTTAQTVNDAAFTLTGTVEAGATVDVLKAGNSIGAASVTGINWTFATTLTEGANLFTATASDAAGNVSAASAVVSITLDSTTDQTKPTIQITSAATSPTNTNPIPINLLFSEPLTGFEESDISVSGGVITAGSYEIIDAVSDDGVDPARFTITPSADGLITVGIAADAAQDSATNGNPAASFDITYDGTAPSVSITSDSGNNGNSVEAATLSYTATFSEDVTGFEVGGITVTGTAGVTSATNFMAVSATVYTFDVFRGAPDGTVIVSIAKDSAMDSAGNGNTASDGFVFTIRTPLTITSMAQTVNVNSFTLTGTARPESDLTVLHRVGTSSAPEITLTTTTTNWEVEVTLLEGDNRFEVARNLNKDDTTYSNSVDITLDSTAPAVAITTTAQAVNDAAFTLTGTVEAGATVDVLKDGTSIGAASVTDTTWSLAVTLADGANTFTATASDGAMNTSTPTAAVSITLDTTLPDAPVITQPTTPTNDNTIAISGTAEAGATVTLSQNGNALTPTATANSGGAWSLAVTLIEGANTFTATASDAAGNVSAASAAVSITLDTTAPAQPVITTATPQTVDTATFTLEGTTEADATVTLSQNSNALATTATANSAGAWSLAVTLTEGANLFTATASDAAGNVSAASAAVSITLNTTTTPIISISPATVTAIMGTAITPISITSTGDDVDSYSINPDIGNGLMFDTSTGTISGTPDAVADAIPYTITATNSAGMAMATVSITVEAPDTTPPAPPVITTPAATPDHIITATTPFTVNGTAEAGALVKVYSVRRTSRPILLGGLQDSVTADNNGNWGMLEIELVEDGAFYIATATDAAGNVSAYSNLVLIDLDTTPPEAPLISTTAQTVNTAEFTISGSAEAKASIQLLRADSTLTTTATANSAGAWSLTVTLTEGANTFTATATDRAGHTSSPSAAVSITLDTTAPAQPVITTTTPQTVNDAIFTLTGTVEAGATVDVLKDGASIGTASVTGTDWTFATTLTEGANLFTATASDAAGNVSAASAAVSITLNTTTAPIISISSATVTAIMGTAITPISITSTGGDVDSYSINPDIGNGLMFNTSTGTISGTPAEVTDAIPYTITATNSAGTATATVTITVEAPDTTPPAPPVITTPAATPDHIITTMTPFTVNGTAEAGALVKVYSVHRISRPILLGGLQDSVTADNNGNWGMLEIELVEDGAFYIATATDAAGNVSAYSNLVLIDLDTTPPEAPLISTTAQTVNTAEFTISGSAEAKASIQLLRAGNVISGATAKVANNRQWSITFDLEAGANDITATATDRAGHTSVPSATVSITLDTTAPAQPVITTATPQTVNAATFTLEGTTEADATVTLTQNGNTLTTTATADSSGSWSLAVTLTEGANLFTATASDAAGNVSAASAAVSITLNTTTDPDNQYQPRYRNGNNGHGYHADKHHFNGR